jgi:acetyl esterase
MNNPDYNKLIDDQTWDFIRLTERFYPPETIDYSIAQQRQIYDDMCRQFFNGYPDGVSAEDDHIGHDGISVPVRRYTSARQRDSRHLVYFHGGGFVVGGLDSHDDVCAELCERTGLGVTSVDYRLAPEHRHPAAYQDACACVQHELKRLDVPLLLCGDSAGGNLAAAVTHTMRAHTTSDGRRAIAGQVLIYPGLGGDTTAGSYVTHSEAPMLTTRDVLFYADIRSAPDNNNDNNDDRADASNATMAPLSDADFSNLPDTIIFSAECDPLSDDGRHYSNAIVAAGGRAHWFNERGMVHGYLRARQSVVRAQQSFDRITDALNRLSDSEWYS